VNGRRCRRSRPSTSACGTRSVGSAQQAIGHRIAEIALDLEAGGDVTYAALRRHVAELERALRDARPGPIGGGTDEIMKEILGRSLGL
jgi:acyl-CoA dehydrogenase-like protein